MARRLIATALCGLAALLPAAPAGAATNTNELRDELRSLVAAGVPGAIVEVRDGSRTVRMAAGLGRRSTHTSMRPSDRFRVGSVTKTFVATVVLQLVGEGKLSLDDTVERWLPGVLPDGDQITIRQLLNHTSGLFDYLGDGGGALLKRWYLDRSGRVPDPRQLVGIAASHPALFAPGSQFSYSNTGYVVLGLIVEAATGHPLTDELATRLFAPLGLRATSFDTTPRIAGHHAHGYEKLGRRIRDFTAANPAWAWAAGAIVSTSDDLVRFYRALLGGELMGPQLLEEMETTVPMGHGKGYGLGLERWTVCPDVWGHDGVVPGYENLVFSTADGGRQLVVAFNRSGNVPTGAAPAINRLFVTAFCG